jgi:uncharacterized membrane protein
MRVHFPFGLLLASLVFDALSHLSPGMALPTVAYWMLAAGIVGGLSAAALGGPCRAAARGRPVDGRRRLPRSGLVDRVKAGAGR